MVRLPHARQTDDVTLVTGDKALYEDGDIKKGLSLALSAETADLPPKCNPAGNDKTFGLSSKSVEACPPFTISIPN
jgi:hypothetical protein